MKLTHPTTGQTVEPKAEHVAAYKSQGWVEQAEEPAEPKPAPKK